MSDSEVVPTSLRVPFLELPDRAQTDPRVNINKSHMQKPFHVNLIRRCIDSHFKNEALAVNKKMSKVSKIVVNTTFFTPP